MNASQPPEGGFEPEPADDDGGAGGAARQGLPAWPGWPFFFLLVYVVVLYIRPQEYVAGLMGTPLVPVTLWTAIAAWAIAQPKHFEAPQHKLVAALTAVIFISDLLPDGLGVAVAGTLDFVPAVLMFYLAATSIDSIARLRWLVLVISAVIGVIALHGIEQAASPDGVGWTGAAMVDDRITYLGFFNDPNDLSMAFLMTLPLTIWLAVTQRPGLLRWGAWLVVALTLWATYLCNSRGSILGILAMAAMLAIRRFGWWRSLLVVPVVLVPMLLLAPSRVSEMSADEESAAGRVDAWYSGFEMLREHPVFGVGKGLFVDHNYLTAHNSFVLAIAELGVVGYYVWLANIVLTGVMLVRLLRAAAPDAAQVAAPEPAVAANVYGIAEVPAHDEFPFEAVDASPAHARRVEDAAAALAYSMLGTLVAAFFLSRSYVNILYLLVAMVLAVYRIARVNWPRRFEAVELSAFAGRLFGFELATIVFLWVLTRVLLAYQ